MNKAFQAAKCSAAAPPVLPPEATPAAGPSPAAPTSRSQVPVLAFARADATTSRDAPPVYTQANPIAHGQDWDGKVIHSETKE
eukprot:9307954-Pyramimonas_sp.AAC.1